MKELKTTFEKKYFEQGFNLIVGIDEVGRGCFAGPMYFCAFLFFLGDSGYEGIIDSKQLSKKSRESMAVLLSSKFFFLEIIKNQRIDELGLKDAMNKALLNLIDRIENKYKNRRIAFLIDGYFKGEWNENIFFITRGDAKVYSIAAASILAKVFRDSFMCDIATKYPVYGFEKNVGYGTCKHINAMRHYGLCSLHRKSFKPCKMITKTPREKN